MRRSRMGRTRAIPQTLVFVVVALAIVGSGYLIGKYYLSSLLHKPSGGQPVTGEDPTRIVTETGHVETSPHKLYRVQIGAFSTKENADKLVGQALQKGVGAAVMSPDPLYKVYCGLASSKEAAEKIASGVKTKLSLQEKPYVGTLDIPSYTFSFTGNSSHVKALQGAFELADRSVASFLSYWDSHIMGQDSQVNLSAMERDLEAQKTTLAGLSPEGELAAIHSSAGAIIEELHRAVRAAQEVSGGDSAGTASATGKLVSSLDLYIQRLSELSP